MNKIEAADQFIGQTVPLVFRDKRTLDDIVAVNTGGLKIALQSWLNVFPDNEPAGLYLWSKSSGSGKSLCACVLLQMLVRSGRVKSVVRTLVSDLLDRIRESYSVESVVSDLYLLQEISDVDLVVLEDFGKEKISSWVLSKLFQIFDHAYECRQPIIITSNFTPGELACRLDEQEEEVVVDSLCSRIAGLCKVIQFPEKDYRFVDL